MYVVCDFNSDCVYRLSRYIALAGACAEARRSGVCYMNSASRELAAWMSPTHFGAPMVSDGLCEDRPR